MLSYPYSSKRDYRGTELNKQTKLINALEVAQLKDLKMYFFIMVTKNIH